MMLPRWLDRVPAEGLAVLADASLKGVVVLLAASAAAAALRRASAAERHLVWTLAVLGILVLPALGAVVPAWRIVLPGVPGVPDASVVRGEAKAASVMASTHPAVVARSGDAGVGGEPLAPVVKRDAAPGVRLAPEEAFGAALDKRHAHEEGVRAVPAPWRATDAAGTPAPAPTPRRPSLPAVLVLVWMAGALAVLATIVLGFVRVRWLAGRARPFESGRCTGLVERLAAGLGLRRRVALLRGDAAAMPMTWGILRPAVLLPAGAEAWPKARLRAVLLHELAHVRRRDHVTQLGAELACALYWFNPLVWLAARMLRVEREHACDDRVLAGGAPAADYAGELLDVARSLRTARATSLAAMAMARPSQLEGRLLAVLDEGRSRASVSRRLAVLAALCAACLLLPLAAMRPARAAQQGAADRFEAPRTHVDEPSPEVVTTAPGDEPPDDGTTADELPAGGPPGETAPAPGPAHGDVSVGSPVHAVAMPTAARTALAVPDPAGCRDGAMSTRTNSHSVDGDVRTIKWSGGPRCSLEIRMEGEVEFTEDFAGIGRISPGGLVRIDETDGSTARRLEVRPGPDGELTYEWTVDGRGRAFDREGREWLSGVLLDLFRRTGLAAEQRAAWLLKSSGPEGLLGEVDRMASDYARRAYLQAVVDLERVDPATLQHAIRLAGREISSDYELAELLIAIAGRHAFTGETGTAFIEASQTISSDYEQRRVLSAALARGGLSAGEVGALLRAARHIGSDFELAELLIQLSGEDLSSPTLQKAFLTAASTIASDFEHRRVLSTLLEKERLNAEALGMVLESALTIASDFELAELLVQIVRGYRVEGTLREAYLEAAETIGSRHEYGRVATALLQQERATGTS